MYMLEIYKKVYFYLFYALVFSKYTLLTNIEEPYFQLFCSKGCSLHLKRSCI